MTTTEHADQPPEAPAATTGKKGLIYPGMGLLFVVLICCFTAWGIAADLTTPMVAGFKQIFDMNTFQASLVQLAYFGAYFLLAIPAALINQRFGYKAGLLSGVLLAAAGAIAFYPASKIMTYEAFLVALFAIAAGCSILETSANPYVLSLGPEETATRRLNFAQAFNPVGTNIGVLLAATLILPKLDEPMNMASTRHRSSRPGRPVGCGDGSLSRPRFRAHRHVHRLVQFGQDEGGGRRHAMFVRTGLKAWAKLSRRVAVSSGPSESTTGSGHLQNRASSGDREESDQERLVGHDLAGRIERDRAGRGEQHTGEKAGFVSESLVDQRRRDRQRKCAPKYANCTSDAWKVFMSKICLKPDHGRGEVGGDAPCGEAADEDHEQAHPRVDQTHFSVGWRCSGG